MLDNLTLDSNNIKLERENKMEYDRGRPLAHFEGGSDACRYRVFVSSLIQCDVFSKGARWRPCI